MLNPRENTIETIIEIHSNTNVSETGLSNWIGYHRSHQSFVWLDNFDLYISRK